MDVARSQLGAPPAGVRLVLGGLLFVTFAYFQAPPSWNGVSRMALVRSIVERGRLDIDPFAFETGDKALFRGHHYSDKAPGLALLAVPAYALHRAFLNLTGRPLPRSVPAGVDDDARFNPSYVQALFICTVSTSALAGALLGVLFFAHLGSLGMHPRFGLAATLALCLGTPVFPYATLFYGHVTAGCLLFAAYVVGVAGRGDAGVGAHSPSRWRVFAAGAFAGAAVLVELPSAAAVAGLTLCLALRGGSTRERMALVARFAAGAALPLGVLAAYQWAAFSHPLRPGYGHVTRPEFAAGMAQGLFGVRWPRPAAFFGELVSRGHGLLWVAPVCLLGFVGLVRGLRRGPRSTYWVATGITLGFLLIGAGYYMWWGGSAFGPRHLIPALPFLALGFARLPEGRVWRLGFGVLLAASIVFQLAATATIVEIAPTRDVLFDAVLPRFARGEIPALGGGSNLGRRFGLPGIASLAPLLLIWALGIRTLLRRLPGSHGAPAASGQGTP